MIGREPRLPRLPDRVRDAKLDTEVRDGLTIHTDYVEDASVHRRFRIEKIVWQTTRKIGQGGYGSVYLQERKSRSSTGPAVRAIKRLRQTSHNTFIHELEALAKFSSQPRVGGVNPRHHPR
jgi:serine/threonine protein kinase